MIITVTSIKLRSVWYYFKLTLLGFKIVKQLKSEKGFIKMKNTGFGYDHYTLSVWRSTDDLKRFSGSGAHAEAMKHTKLIATEIRTYTYNSDSLPNWKEVKKLLAGNSKVLNFK
jgi:hypothetical protein